MTLDVIINLLQFHLKLVGLSFTYVNVDLIIAIIVDRMLTQTLSLVQVLGLRITVRVSICKKFL